jgi:ABC-type multidrug transport system ATPase subunit
LVADSLSCRLGGRFGLTDVYLDLRDRDIVGLVGRNGCGKTTLIRTLLGLVDGASGVVKVDGRFVPPRQRWRHMAYLPQQSFLPRDSLVRRASAHFLGTPGELIVRDDPRLRQLAHRRVGDLSSGERRHLEFRLVLGLGRNTVLLDEPFSQIEPLYVQLMSEIIRSESAHRSFLLTDHNHWSIRSVSTKLLNLDQGRIRSIGSGDTDLQRAGYLPTDDPPSDQGK